MIKRILSVLLSILMVVSVTAVGFVTAGAVTLDPVKSPVGEPVPTARITVYGLNGQSEVKEFQVGDTFSVYTYLNASDIADNGRIDSVNGSQTYTDVLLPGASDFPILDDGYDLVVNNGAEGRILYNASTPSIDEAFRFDSDDDLLIVTTYTVTAPGEGEVRNTLQTLTAADELLTPLVKNGEIRIEKPVQIEAGFDMREPAPTEAPTEHIHTPGEPVRENEVPAFYDIEGSYDLVYYCTECGVEIARETVIVPALIPPTEAPVPTEAPATEAPTVAPATEAPLPTEAPPEPTEAPVPTAAPATEAPLPTEAPYEPTVAPYEGYYLVGSFNGWSIDLSYRLERNYYSYYEEYVYSGWYSGYRRQFKIAYSYDGVSAAYWYPAGMGNSYGENGELYDYSYYDIYFRPNYNGGYGWFDDCIYAERLIEPTEAPYEPTVAPYEPTVPYYPPTEPSVRPTMPPGMSYDYYDSYTVSSDTPYTEDAILACGGSLYDTQTIYFQAPEDWANKYNTFYGPDDSEPYMHVCIFWWTGVGSHWPNGNGVKWVGYQAHLENKANRIYAAKVPAEGTCNVVWNNGVNGGMDKYAEIFNYGHQVYDANIEGAEPGEYDTLPEGTPDPDNMDGCIQIMAYDREYPNELTYISSYGTNWYIYYGGGCYGTYSPTSYHFTGQTENCLNPEHYDNGDPATGTHTGGGSSGQHGGVSPNCLNFDNSYTNWIGPIRFYVYVPGEGEIIAWGSKKLNGTDNGDGTWSYDPTEMGLTAGKQYAIIFQDAATGDQTYDLLFDTSCIGDTAYCTGSRVENVYDSNKTSLIARWRDHYDYGPVLAITSIGSVIGEICPANTTPYGLFEDFLENYFYNARVYSGKDDQTLLDDIGRALGLTANDVQRALAQSGVYSEWSKNRSSLPGTSSGGGSGKQNCLNFDNSFTDWIGPVKFYVYVPGEGEIIAWGSKKLNGTDNGDGIWSYDPSALGLVPGKQYAIIFNDSTTGAQTYDLLFDTSCIGDVAYVTGSYVENPVDSNKTSLEARWKNSASFGPMLRITSIGNVIGETCPANTTPYRMFVDFLKDMLYNARAYTGKSDQAILDDTAAALGLTDSDIEKAISEAGVSADWRSMHPEPTTAPTEPPEDAHGYVPNAFYLTGSIGGDNSGTAKVHKELRFKASSGDQMLLSHVRLTKGDVVKAARYNGSGVFTVYPDGVGREVAIDTTGYYDFYFKPYEMGNGNYWFITPAFTGKIGDADGDGEITSIDVTLIQRFCADMDTGVSASVLMNADIDGNGSVEIIDATFAQRLLAGMAIPFAVV